MFGKYFRVLRAVDEFTLRPEVDAKMKSSATLMLIPFVDHLVFGAVDPIIPIVARGGGYSNAKGWDKKNMAGFGEPGRFEIRFDTPAEVTDTYTKRVVKQCQCMKCGTRRDVQVIISVDPNPNAPSSTTVPLQPLSKSSTSTSPRKSALKTTKSSKTVRYAPGYALPTEDTSTLEVPPVQPPRPVTPDMKKQCLRCTFLNHPDLTVCEMCQADLPTTAIAKPPSPGRKKSPSHPPATSNATTEAASRAQEMSQDSRPPAPSRNSLSQSLFSIFPFNQQHQEEHHAKLPPTQQTDTSPAHRAEPLLDQITEIASSGITQETSSAIRQAPEERPKTPPSPPRVKTAAPHTPPHSSLPFEQEEPTLSRAPEMTMMPLTPPPTTQSKRPAPAGLPTNLMDDFVPVSPGLHVDEVDAEDAGWGEMSKEEARGIDDSDDDNDEAGKGFIDLDAVAMGEAGAWGERDDD